MYASATACAATTAIATTTAPTTTTISAAPTSAEVNITPIPPPPFLRGHCFPCSDSSCAIVEGFTEEIASALMC